LKGFKFNICAPGFCYFRKPTNTAYLDTYAIPPPTTIRGLLANAMGFARGDYRLQECVFLGIRANSGEIIEEYAQLLKEPKSYFPDYMYDRNEYDKYLRIIAGDSDGKLSEEEVIKKAKKTIKDNGYKVRSSVVEYSSSPMKRRVILDADYTVYVASEDEKLAIKLREKLFSPERPLYLGASDSIADVYDISNVIEIHECDSDIVHTVCGGIHEGGTLIKLPYQFVIVNRKINLIYTPVLTIFNRYPASVSRGTKLFRFKDEYVYLL